MSTQKVSKPTSMYSWWWDSHISPKNSKWLKENLEDMDDRVRTMIKLIEQDADSFGRRAEMYYAKRPELMKLVEEFYREYRALAERYDHVTGALYQAHRTIFKSFPNQISPPSTDDSTISSLTQLDPQTPQMQLNTQTLLFTPEDLLKDNLAHSFPDLPSGKPIFTANSVKKILKFDELGEDNQSDPFDNSIISYETFDQDNRSGDGVEKLKDTLSNLQDEHDATLLKHQTTLDKLHELESELSRAHSDCRKHSEQASKAEKEVNLFKETIARLQADKEDALLRYNQCVDKICDIENVEDEFGELAARVSQSEIEARIIKDALMTLKDEAASLFLQQDIIPTLQNKLLQAEEELEREKGRAGKDKKEAESLERACILLAKERDEAAFKCQQYEEKISTLEQEIVCLQGEANRLYVEVDEGALRLKRADECCQLLKNSNQSLHSKIESLLLKLGTQCRELTQKQNELGNLWTCIQEERFKFKEVETAFEALQFLHFQSQEQLKYLSTNLEEETRRFSNENALHKEENNRLNELFLSLSLSLNATKNENTELRENNAILENSLSDMSTELEAVREKVKSLEESCRSLLIEETSLISEKANLLSQIQSLSERCEKLMNTNTLLENSLSDTCTELEGTKEKLKELEESCCEKSVIISERDILFSRLQTSQYNLKKMETLNKNLEQKYIILEKERESMSRKMRDVENSEAEEVVCSQIEILVLQKYIETANADMKKLYSDNNALAGEIEKHKSESVFWEKEIATLFSNLQASSVREAFFVKKTAELAAICREVSCDSGIRNRQETRDILLDEACENHSKANATVELWETSDQDGSIDLTVAKVRNANDGTAPVQARAARVKDFAPGSGVVGSFGESEKYNEQCWEEEDRGKVLERLQSDAQKLINLRIALDDLKAKIEVARKKKGEKAAIEGQLDGMDATILKLLDVVWKLMAVQEKDEHMMRNNTCRRQRVVAQARRVSERIGRLQVELQKIQFMFVRVNSVKESRKRFRIYTRKTRVLLQDFLSHSLRTSDRRRRNVFCACAEPCTTGD